MGYAHTSPHQKENERAAGATFKWPWTSVTLTLTPAFHGETLATN